MIVLTSLDQQMISCGVITISARASIHFLVLKMLESSKQMQYVYATAQIVLTRRQAPQPATNHPTQLLQRPSQALKGGLQLILSHLSSVRIVGGLIGIGAEYSEFPFYAVQLSILTVERLHERSRHSFRCPHSDCAIKSFSSRRSLQRHLETIHVHENDQHRRYFCRCGSSTNRKDHHMRHIKTCNKL